MKPDYLPRVNKEFNLRRTSLVRLMRKGLYTKRSSRKLLQKLNRYCAVAEFGKNPPLWKI